jgi:hypothetical protein
MLSKEKHTGYAQDEGARRWSGTDGGAIKNELYASE